MIVGMDFGTTHSGMSIYDGETLRAIPLHEAAATERVTPTMLYVTNDQKITFGREAMETYYAHNVGRPVKMEKVWVGEITLTFAELPTFVRDVYIWVDALSPGRLFLSFKTDLADISYQGTTVGRFFYRLEDIVALYLNLAKRRAERFLDRELDSILLGRPVRFAADPQANALAQERLLDAALRAGYKRVSFAYEPIAAAYYYELTLQQPQNVLIFDFGGGTLDVSIMRLGDPQQRAVLATGGVPVAGDIFDRKLVRAKLPHHFGQGSYYRSLDKWLPIPDWIYENFTDWRTLITLQTPENLQTIRSMIPTAQEPHKLEALLSLVSGNYGLKMYDEVEKVKRRLSSRKEAVIRLIGEDFHAREPVTRSEFEALIGPEYRTIEEHIDETVRASGLRPDQIDAVIRTGGSSQIPLFQRMLAQKFGAEKVHAIDTFGSVTAGLGVMAHHIHTGAMDAHIYTKSTRVEQLSTDRRSIPLVDLQLLQQQIALEETAQPADAAPGIAFIDREYALRCLGDVQTELPPETPGLALHDVPVAGVAAQPDEPLLLLTSRFQCLLLTLRELLSYEAAGRSIGQVHGFEPGEQLCTLQRWNAVRAHGILALISTQGHLRTFPMEQIAPLIEGPTPHRISWGQSGWPKVVIGAEPSDALVAVNSHGRAVQCALSAVPRTGARLLQKRKGDEIVGLVAGDQASTLLLFSTQGYGKRLRIGDVPTLEQVSAKGASVVRRRGEICTAMPDADSIKALALTTQGIVALGLDQLPAADDAPSMHALLPLGKREQLLRVLSL